MIKIVLAGSFGSEAAGKSALEWRIDTAGKAKGGFAGNKGTQD